MSKLLLGLAFVIALFTLPWWASVFVAILYLAEGGNPLLVIIGGFVFDEIFGVAHTLGFAYAYTLIAIAISCAVLYLRRALLE